MHKKHIPYYLIIFTILSIFNSYVIFISKPINSSLIGYVDTDYLIKNIVQDIARKDLSKELIESETKLEISYLDQAIKKIAQARKFIILPKAAIVAGGLDITEEVQKLMSDKNG